MAPVAPVGTMSRVDGANRPPASARVMVCPRMPIGVLLPEIFAIDLAWALPPAIVTEVAAVGSQRPGRGGADLVA